MTRSWAVVVDAVTLGAARRVSHHGVVSVYFEIRRVPVWNPASAVGVFYADQLEAAARFAGLESDCHLFQLTGSWLTRPYSVH